jgi:flavin-dependent dehydrogenase
VAAAIVGNANQIVESPKDIPLVQDVDVVIVGGSSGAVACACAAADQGARVFLLAPRPYLGTDICATLRLWLEEGERPSSKLAVACFGKNRCATPYAVKAAMDRALLEAGVSYLTGCYATDVLRDEDGQIAGVVMANRSGRQAVRAKVVVDATERAVVARLANAPFRPFAPGPHTFKRVVIGGPMRSGDAMSGQKKDVTCRAFAADASNGLPVYEYTLQIDLPRNDVSSFQQAENRARDATYTAGSETASERLFYVPSDTLIAEERLLTWDGADGIGIGPFRPRGTARLYVLGAHADMGRNVSHRLLRPPELMAVASRIGAAAAFEAAELPDSRAAHLPESAAEDGISATVGEDLDGVRSKPLGWVHAGRRPLPVLGRYDVVVVGGGTSGAPAGIAAAKCGAKTLVVEYLHELGGVGTVGLIGAYWRGLRRGYTAYVDSQTASKQGKWRVGEKAEWLRRELHRCGAQVWFGTLACGAVFDRGKVQGVVVATPWGRGVVLATVVVDATGNSDVAACAGAATQYGMSDRGSLNVQIAGFPDRPLRKSYVNTAYTIVDDTDVLDVWHLMAWKRTSSSGKMSSFDVGQLVDSRERRRIIGDYVLKTHDILTHRTFPDTISQHYSNFDAAAFPDADLLLLENAKGPNFHTDLPYRCLLPKGLDGILVVGLGCSADRDAMTLIRMQPDLQNQGYAAGLAAAAAAQRDGRTRQVDIKSIQQQLVQEGTLDDRVVTDRDSFPLSGIEIEEAVDSIGKQNAIRALAVVVAQPETATPLLKVRYRSAASETVKLKYAQVLAVLGDSTGAATLIQEIDAYREWDEGVPLTSERKTGNTFSRLDRLVIALGRSRAPEGLETLVRKLGQLSPGDKLSHYKALALALRHYPPCDATAEPLWQLLQQRGFAGHTTSAPWLHARADDQIPQPMTLPERRVTGNARGVNLNAAYKELIVAAMLYRCGDRNSTGSAILEQYTYDVHGHFARYARRALADGTTRIP